MCHAGILCDDFAHPHLSVILAVPDGALVLLLALELEDQNLVRAILGGNGCVHADSARAFAGDETLRDMNDQLQANGYRTLDEDRITELVRARAAASWRASRGERLLAAL